MHTIVSEQQIAIMQPTFLPWLGYFDLIDRIDLMVFLDSVQFERQSWQQRNRLKIGGELQWLTVPVLRSGHAGDTIREMQIDLTRGFPQKLLRTIEQHYHRAPYFAQHFPQMKETLESGECSLSALNRKLIQWLVGALGLRAEFRLSSEMQATGRRSALLVGICQELGVKKYLSPFGSASYILEDREEFERAEISVAFQHYEHPDYSQLSLPFLPYASTLDLLFNEGDASIEILRSGQRPHYSLDEVRQLTAQASTIK